jgi:hypothetical protein
MERLKERSHGKGWRVTFVLYENRKRKGYAIQITSSITVKVCFNQSCYGN